MQSLLTLQARYNECMSDVKEFRPELTSRRGEIAAWVVAFGMSVALYLADAAWGSMSVFAWLFAGFLFFSAASISLGNWVDRHSVIRMDSDGIGFENGLRSVRLSWPEVQNVAVTGTRFGKRVQVIGPKSHFTFKMLSESEWNGQVFRTGFAAGREILEAVLKSSGLQLKAETEGLYYYARA